MPVKKEEYFPILSHKHGIKVYAWGKNKDEMFWPTLHKNSIRGSGIDGNEIVIIDENYERLPNPQKGVQAFITAEKYVPIGFYVSDCLVIFIYDPYAHVLAAVHGGRDSLLNQNLDKTIKIMVEKFRKVKLKHLIVDVSPCICKKCYTIDSKHFISLVKEHKGLLKDVISPTLPQDGCPEKQNSEFHEVHFDLWQLAKNQLDWIPEKNIAPPTHCTFSEEKLTSLRQKGKMPEKFESNLFLAMLV